MSNFLIILPSRGNLQQATEVFHEGVRFAERIRQQKATKHFEADWVSVATFPRMNGSLCPLVVDQASGDWVLISGTWFHQDGWGSGQEQRLLRRLQDVGSEKVAHELEGFFVLVFGDGRKKELTVTTDLIGSCHVYVRTLKGLSAISGSSLMLASLSTWNLDPIGCQEFLSTGVMYEDRTFYHEVKKISSSLISSYQDGALRSSRPYWRVQDLSPESLDEQEAVEIISQKLLNSARTLRSSFPRPLCDLTGGYDSRMIVSAFLKAEVDFGTTVSGDSESGDVRVSQAIASKFGLLNWQVPSDWDSTVEDLQKIIFLTDGEYDLIEYANVYHIHQSLMEKYDISVNGSFGEVARGYWWELLFPNPASTGKLDGVFVARKRYAVQNHNDALFPQSQRLELSEHFGDIINRTNMGLWDSPKSLQMDYAYLKMRMQRWQGRIASSTNQIWPCFSPFMLRSILEPILQIRVASRRRNGFVRSLLHDLNPELANMPMEHGWPAVPVTWKNAYRFWPLPMYYGKKVLNRLLPIRLSPKSQDGNRLSLASRRLTFWQNTTIRDLLNPSTMELGHLLDQARMERFITRSQDPNFNNDAQWAKVLSLELTLHHLKQVKQEVRL